MTKMFYLAEFENQTIEPFIRQVKEITLQKTSLKKSDTLTYIPAGICENNIYYNENLYSIYEFLSLIKSLTTCLPILVLSKKEKNILTRYILHNIKIYVFEDLFPYYSSKIKYVSNSYKNYIKLIWFIKKEKYIYKYSYIDQININLFYKIVKKIKKKSSLDDAFSILSSKPYQDVFVLEEKRPNRAILALDINSMYANFLDKNFPNINNLEYYVFNQKLDDNILKLYGMFEVILSKASTNFIKKYNYFNFSKDLQHIPFSITEKDTLKIFVTNPELQFYKNHFEDIFIIRGIFSRDYIKYPCSKHISSLYLQRKNYKKQNNKVLSDKIKLFLSTAYSSTKKNLYNTIKFQTPEDALLFLNTTYSLNEITLEDLIQKYQYNQLFTIFTKDSFIYIKYKCIKSNRQIFSLYKYVISYARIHILTHIMKFSSYQDSLICYSNADSIHISIPDNKLNNFLDVYKENIGESIGQFKIEAIANKGLWLEPGRYFLFKDKKVVTYKNIGINRNASKNIAFRKIDTYILTKNTSYPLTYYYSINNAVKLKKQLEIINNDLILLKKYTYQELLNKIDNPNDNIIKPFSYIKKAIGIKHFNIKTLLKIMHYER